MTVVARIGKKKVIVEEEIQETTVPLGGGPVEVEVEFNDLTEVETILNVITNLDPAVEVSGPVNTKKLGHNKIKTTLVFSAGTTLTGSVIAIGY